MSELEIERKIKEILINAGWDVKFDEVSNNFRSDFSLYFDGKLYGYVEAIMFKKGNERYLYDKLEQAFSFIKRSKPLMFVVTDGYQFHISFRGKPFELLHFMPGPYDGPTVVAVVENYVEYVNGKGDDNDD